MMRLEDLTPNAAVRGILPECLVTVVSVHWYGSGALELTYGSLCSRRSAREQDLRNERPGHPNAVPGALIDPAVVP